MSKPSPKRDARTAHILHTATELLLRDGPEALSVQRLAGALGWSAGALYRYFDSKDALLVAIQAQNLVVLGGFLGQAWSLGGGASWGLDERGSSLLGLALACRAYAGLPRWSPGRFRLLALSIGEPRHWVEQAAAGPVLEGAAQLLGAVEAGIGRAESAGALSVSEGGRRARVLWLAVHGVASAQKFERFGSGALWHEALLDDLLLALLVGWGAQATEAAQALERARGLESELAALAERLDEQASEVQ
jgi:AcrR family transcriptional regulator